MGMENSGEEFQVFENEINFFFYALVGDGEDSFVIWHTDMTLVRRDIPLHTTAFYIIYIL